jgi:hypothetical protein
VELDATSPFESVLAIALLGAGQLEVVGNDGPLAILPLAGGSNVGEPEADGDLTMPM